MRYAALFALVPAAIVCAQAPQRPPRPSLTLKTNIKGINYVVTNVTEVWLTDANGNVLFNDLPTQGALPLPPGKYIFRAQGYRGQQIYEPFITTSPRLKSGGE